VNLGVAALELGIAPGIEVPERASAEAAAAEYKSRHRRRRGGDHSRGVSQDP